MSRGPPNTSQYPRWCTTTAARTLRASGSVRGTLERPYRTTEGTCDHTALYAHPTARKVLRLRAGRARAGPRDAARGSAPRARRTMNQRRSGRPPASAPRTCRSARRRRAPVPAFPRVFVRGAVQTWASLPSAAWRREGSGEGFLKVRGNHLAVSPRCVPEQWSTVFNGICPMISAGTDRHASG
eukprot:scaffold1996_cov377-Prasinococcus_capsulatus_cf.AAC.10